MTDLENWLIEIAIAADGYRLLSLPSGFHSLPPEQKAAQAALIACRIKDRRNQGDPRTTGFYRRHQRLLAGVPAKPRDPSNPLKVGFVSPSLNLGGAERWIVSVLKHIRWDDSLACSGVAVLQDGEQDFSHRARELTTVLQGRGACATLSYASDVIVAWGIDSPEVTFPDFRGRLVVISHGHGQWTRQMLKGCLDRGTDLVAVSQAAASAFPDPSAVTVIYNGIDVDRVTPKRTRDEVRTEWGLKDREIAVGFVGRYSPEKNPLAAAVAVSTLGRPYRAVYVGDGWDRERTLSTVRRLCPDAVIVPSVDNVGDIFSALDCFILASPSEGFSLAMTEAWFCGCPTVATPVGVLPELEAQHGRLAIDVPVSPSPVELAAAVQAAVSEANRPIVDRAKKVARSHYTSGDMGRRWTEFLLGLC